MLNNEKLAGLIVFTFAFIGVVANWTVAILIRKLPSLKNSFGRLTASQSIGDAIHCTVFAFLFAPMCFFITNTKILVFLSWTCAVLPSFYLYIYNDCSLFYIDDFWMFTFATTPICVKIVWYADFLKYNSIVVFIVIIDVITVSKVRSYKAHLAKTSSKAQFSRRQSAEMNFLRQACLQAVVFVCELITYFIISPKVDPSQRWLIFSLTTFAWVCVHMLDGIITLTFNKEFTQIIFRGRNTVTDYGVSRSNLEATSNAASATKY